MQHLRHIAVALFLCILPLQVVAAETPDNSPGQQFEAARTALNSNDLRSFKKLRAALDDYPLAPYLDIWQARAALKNGIDKDIPVLLITHADVPETINLRIAWLNHLARHGEWDTIASMLKRYPGDKRRVPEVAMVAAWKAGAKEEAFAMLSERWIKGYRISSYAQPLFSAWQHAGHPKRMERWQRIGREVSRGRWHKVKQQQRHLATRDRKLISFWKQAQRDPKQLISAWPKKIDSEIAEMILDDVVNRLARKDVHEAWQLLANLEKQSAINELGEIKRAVALRAARRHEADAAAWLASLDTSLQTSDTREWHARLLMLGGQWDALISQIDQMPDSERKQSNWIYWKARALELNGSAELAEPLYLLLADERGFYSFLAAERLGLKPKLHSTRLTTSSEMINELSELPAIRRAYEWLQLGNSHKASREWHFALQGRSPRYWRAAAVIAQSWQWPDQTIRAAYKAGEHDALQSRFPLAFADEVKVAAEETGLTTAAIWSIIRQESAFNEKANSYVGARGLMQLMPRTARSVAKRIKLNTRHPDLYSAATNVRLGASYLSQMHERFGNLALAAAAYNAGPHRVSSWLNRSSFTHADAWIEAIPFNETRRYVQQVMAFMTVYEWRQQQHPSSLLVRIGAEQQLSLNLKGL